MAMTDLPSDEEMVLVRYGSLVAARCGSGRFGLGTCCSATGQSGWTAAYHRYQAGVNTSESAAKVSP